MNIRKNIVPILCVVALFIMAAKPANITHLTSLWVGDNTDTADVTPGDNDVFISGTLEVNGAVRLDGAVTMTSTLSGCTITDHRSFDLGALVAEDQGPITSSTVPDLNEVDNVPKVTWANSGETSGIQITESLPGYSSGLKYWITVSTSDSTTPASKILDWELWVNGDNVTFDAAAVAQTQVAMSSTSASASHEVIVLTVDATGEAAISAGDIITTRFFNATTDDYTLEILNIERRYTRTVD